MYLETYPEAYTAKQDSLTPKLLKGVLKSPHMPQQHIPKHILKKKKSAAQPAVACVILLDKYTRSSTRSTLQSY